MCSKCFSCDKTHVLLIIHMLHVSSEPATAAIGEGGHEKKQETEYFHIKPASVQPYEPVKQQGEKKTMASLKKEQHICIRIEDAPDNTKQ